MSDCHKIFCGYLLGLGLIKTLPPRETALCCCSTDSGRGGAVSPQVGKVHDSRRKPQRQWNCVRVLGRTSEAFPVGVGLRQGCALSPILFVVFMDRISRRSRGEEGLQFGGLRISSLL
ncbi:hypothetical protein FVA96_23905, partial [Escherichia coli]|nr:hypothetical protein [Escherichia coli]